MRMALLGAAVLVIGQGCGTLTNQGKQKITVRSTPSAARFQIPSAKVEGITPAQIELDRMGWYEMTIDKDGYKPRTVQISCQPACFPLLVDALWRWEAIAVDVLTGGAFELQPSTVSVKLQKE